VAGNSGVNIDSDITCLRRSLYVLSSTGLSISSLDPGTKGIQKTISLSLAANTKLTGLTNNRRLFVGVMQDTLGVTSDKLAWFDSSGARVNEVLNSDGKINKYKQLCFLRSRFYLLDGTANTVDVYSVLGTKVGAFALTAGKTYTGVATDGHSLWMTRSDTTNHLSGTIENWSISGLQIKSFGFPTSVSETVSVGITFNRRYKIISYTLVGVID